MVRHIFQLARYGYTQSNATGIILTRVHNHRVQIKQKCSSSWNPVKFVSVHVMLHKSIMQVLAS